MPETLHPLAPLTFPLHGSRLIEASAGTGKTWTIAALVVRLVLGHGGANAFAPQGQPCPLQPAQILVMTFTRAATRELSERIRARLVEAAACFRGHSVGDDFLHDLLATYPEATQREQAAWRLELAAQGMDDAAIFTIDAWCQRVLREHALDSGSLLDETLEADEAQRLTEALQDYWRQQCYPLDAPNLERLQAQWKNFAAFANDIRPLAQENLDPALGAGDLADLLPQWEAQAHARLHALAHGWAQAAEDYEIWLEGQWAHNKDAWDGRRLQRKNCLKWLQALKDWAAAPHPDLASAMATGAWRLTPAGLDDARSGAAPVNYPPQAAALERLLAELAALPSPHLHLRQHAAARVQQRLQWIKSQTATFGFTDMLQRLDAALTGPQGAVLRQRLLQQYPVALLDEFQDTSPLQYRLFSSVYSPETNTSDRALLLIGDPKQSIYGFRGADIYSYLQARQATAGRHYVLDKNYRSSHALVAAVNHWFAQAENRPGSGAFRFRTHSAHNPLPFIQVAAQGRPEVLHANGTPVPALHMAWHAAPEAVSGQDLRTLFAAACAEQLAQWLNDPGMGFAQPDGRFVRLRPGDVAILVRQGKEASAVRQALRQRRIASVYLSDRESVFASPEAHDLLFWLRAVAEPLNTRTLRAAFATRLLDLPFADLQQLAHDDALLDQRTAQLHRLHQLWQRQGVLAMLRSSLHQLGLPARWLAQPDGERRLTNVLHLGELLQQASATVEGEQALIRWLQESIANPNGDAQAQTVRLESDADLVQVITIHKSKGLEYPLVMLPFASDFTEKERARTPFVRRPDGRLVLQVSDHDLAQAEEERLREDLRLFYVAATRPRHLLWLGLGPIKKRKKSCQNERSATGYLLAGDAPQSAAQWQSALETLAKSCPNSTLTLIDKAPTATLFKNERQPAALRPAPPYDGQFDRSWGVASFSALVRDLGAAPRPDEALLAQTPAEDEPAAPPSTAAPSSASAVWHRFPKGPLVGNFLHSQMQWWADQGFAPLDGPLRQALLGRCLRAGYSQPQAEDVAHWLSTLGHTPLPPLDCALPALTTQLTEMEFWLPLAPLSSSAVDALCQHYLLPGQARPALPQRQLHGMAMGFADLVFAHGGRYWVLDYKTNTLGPDGSAYTPTTLAAAMLQHRYDVQAALYTLALHRLLRQRLGAAYRPEDHLGGALYLFMRGLDGTWMQHLPIPSALLDALEALITAPAEACA